MVVLKLEQWDEMRPSSQSSEVKLIVLNFQSSSWVLGMDIYLYLSLSLPIRNFTPGFRVFISKDFLLS